jgi:hypothetical protein
MVEIFKHVFGLCGEGHISILPILLSGGAGFGLAWTWLKSKFYHDHDSCEECNKETDDKI